jgi:hypothetical protein
MIKIIFFGAYYLFTSKEMHLPLQPIPTPRSIAAYQLLFPGFHSATGPLAALVRF